VVATRAASPSHPTSASATCARSSGGFDKEEPGPDAGRAAGGVHPCRPRRAAAEHGDAHRDALPRGRPGRPGAAGRRLPADEDAPTEERLRALERPADLARYLDRPDVVELATRCCAGARAWVAAGDEGERRYRLRTVQS
jgi:hypothetical protein